MRGAGPSLSRKVKIMFIAHRSASVCRLSPRLVGISSKKWPYRHDGRNARRHSKWWVPGRKTLLQKLRFVHDFMRSLFRTCEVVYSKIDEKIKKNVEFYQPEGWKSGSSWPSSSSRSWVMTHDKNRESSRISNAVVPQECLKKPGQISTNVTKPTDLLKLISLTFASEKKWFYFVCCDKEFSIKDHKNLCSM